MEEIEVGDFVVDKVGWIWRVTNATGLPVLLTLEHKAGPTTTKKSVWKGQVKLVQKAKKEEDKEMTDKTLYEIKDNLTGNTLYGFKLAVNSQGQWVMEVKGSGQVITASKDQVMEVLPYTIAVEYKIGGTQYHYFNEARDLKVNDFFINTAAYDGGGQYQIGRVVALDTKSKTAKAEIQYFKKLK